MNFTREPIIETVITPRDGCKLVIRNSKGSGQEDYFVDAVEVVSFGHSFFFRSLERPKSFLVPMSDYEILELKETRMALKNVVSDRSIKIGGGRETPLRTSKPEAEDLGEEIQQETSSGAPPVEKKRDRRRSRRRRPSPAERAEEAPVLEESEQAAPSQEEPQALQEAPPSFISKLFPPPATLIKETLTRYKPMEEEVIEQEDQPEMHEGLFDHSELPMPHVDEEIDTPVSKPQAPMAEDETQFED